MVKWRQILKPFTKFKNSSADLENSDEMEKGEQPDELLKQLTASIFNDKPEFATRMYKVIAGVLFPKASTRSCSDNANVPKAGQLRDGCYEIEKFLKDQKLVVEYLEKNCPADALKYVKFCEKIEHDADVHLNDRLATLRFLIQLGKKANSDQPILDKIKIPTSTARFLPVKSGRKNDDTDGTDASRPSSSSECKSLSPSSLLAIGTPRASPRLKTSPLNQPPPARPLPTPDDFNADLGGGLRERELLKSLLFVWQGVHSQIFRLDETSRRYLLHEKWNVYPWVREQANNLATLGYLHDCLVPFSQAQADSGRVRNCVAGFVRDQLSDYYALIASLRTQEENGVRNGDNKNFLTLESLRVQSLPVARTLMDLISILEFTAEDRGGYLASGIYCFICHGDPDLQRLVKKFLAEICQPLYGMLTKWVLEGNLCDPTGEFFIAVDSHVASERLWLEKYSIRQSMLPEFISPVLAARVLSVGRSLNFLRETCSDSHPFAERQKIKELFQCQSAEVMYLMEKKTVLEQLIDQAYQETNKRVLQVLRAKYSMLDHFQAHRKFLLLGQGDFIHHLMDLLLDVLNQPADQVHPHYLHGILDEAVRATTAQFEPEDILKRLDVAMLNSSTGDVGWDLFYLRYHVDGPIGTVFSASSDRYQLLFYALWKAKRIEMVLSKSWKHQITSAKALRRIGELAPVLKQCHELTAEMVHFVRQTQYYFLFEVLECAWNQLLDDVDHAESLDCVIDAHQAFLEKVTNGVFKNTINTKLSTQLRMVYDLVLQLVELVNSVLLEGEKEAKARSSLSGPARGVVDSSKLEYYQRRRDFVAKYLPSASSSLKVLGRTYRDTVKKLLLMLNSEPDLNLQLLSIRLDFNEFYKKIDSSLETPLTFQHRRFSSIGGGGDLSPVLARKLTPKEKSKK